MNIISENLKRLRAARGLSTRRLALLAGVSNGYISQLEKGYDSRTKKPIHPTFDILKKIASGLNVNVNELSGVDAEENIAQRAIKLSETMDLSEARKTALEVFGEMPPEEQTKRLLTMYKKLKSLPLDQQKALELLINNLSDRQ
jgi:transcriptional regulator with XRE-family HTH domain